MNTENWYEYFFYYLLDTRLYKNGTCVSVTSDSPASFDHPAYDVLNWTKSQEVINVGEQGTESEIVTYTLVCPNATKKRLGTNNANNQTFEAIFDSDSAAQFLINNARENGAVLSFRIEYSNDDVVFYRAFVPSAKKSSGGASDLIKLNIVAEIHGDTLVQSKYY